MKPVSKGQINKKFQSDMEKVEFSYGPVVVSLFYVHLDEKVDQLALV